MTPEDPRQPERLVELRAWASEHGVVNQAAGNMIIVHGGVNRHQHHHQHFHSGGQEDERTTTPSSVDECPYPGLRAFDWADSDWFFGREALVGRLVSRLEACLADHRPLAVVAPSGAGKSSLLRAGLLPALANGKLPGSADWPRLLLTPTADPLAALASALHELTGAEEEHVLAAMADGGNGTLASLIRERLVIPPGGRLVLVVDQLEELFTLCRVDAVRHRFVDALAELTGTGTPVAVAVYGLRADAYGDCATFPHLRDALVNRQVIVGPMTEGEVRKAMIRPAELGRLKLAPGLVDVILNDLRGTARRDEDAYETGRLPLLAHALRATWHQRRDDTLTVGSYGDTGGIDGAVQATAEDEFGKLPPDSHRAARQMFLGLVRMGENGEVTRRRRTRADLLLATSDQELVPGLVKQFTDARLLTLGVERGEPTVEVTHEALLWAWRRLRDWIAEAGSGALTRQKLEETAVAWQHGDRKDVTVLYRGPQLESARSWAAVAGPEHLNPLLTDFLAASQRHHRRSQLLRRGAVAVITVLALLASGLAAFAFDQSDKAVQQRNNAIFDRVTAEADRQRDTNSALAAQLDLVAYRMRPTAELRTRLTQTAGAVLPTPLPGRQHGIVHSVSFGKGGALAVGTDELRVWNASDPRRPALLGTARSSGKGARVAAAYNERGDLMALGTGGGKIRIVDSSDARHPVALSAWLPVASGSVSYLRFSPDGRTLALVTSEQADGVTTGIVQLWSVADPRSPRRLSTVLSARGQSVSSVAFNPMGTTLAVGGGTAPGSDRSHLLRLWDITDPARPAALGGDLGGHTGIVNQVAFSPLSDLLASAGGDSKVFIWDVSKPRRPKQVRQLFLSSPADSVAFSPDARFLASGEDSGDVYLWNAGTPDSTRVIGPALRGHTTTVTSLAFDPTSRTLASGSGDGKVVLWHLPDTLAMTDSGVSDQALALSGDGRLLAAASGGVVSLWDVSDPRRLTRVGTLPRFSSNVNALAFRPGASGAAAVLATGDASGAVRLWDVSAPARPEETGEVPRALTKPVGGLAFDAEGHTLVASGMQLRGGYAGGLRAWNTVDPARPTALDSSALSEMQTPIRAIAAAPGGEYVYTSGFVGGTLDVWRTGDGAAPSLAGQTNSGQITMVLTADPRGGLVATGSGESKVRLWDVSDPARPDALGNPLAAGGITTGLAFSPDGKLLAGGTGIGQIRLWNTSTPAHPTAYGLPVTGHNGSIAALLFSPRDGLLITGGDDGTVRLWQTDPAGARTMICTATRTAMTRTVWKEYVSPDLAYDPPCDA